MLKVLKVYFSEISKNKFENRHYAGQNFFINFGDLTTI